MHYKVIALEPLAIRIARGESTEKTSWQAPFFSKDTWWNNTLYHAPNKNVDETRYLGVQ